MASRIEELFQELAESAGGQQQFQIDQQLRQQEAQRELYDTDEARTALKIIGGLLTLGIPLPGMRARGVSQVASQVPGVNKLYGQVGQDFTKFIDPLKSKLSGIFGRSGSGVGADVVGRNPLPKIKDPVVTKRGPRGPTNIDSPNQMPLPLSGGRNTGGISATERAQLPNPYRVRESSRLQSPRDPYYPLEAKNVPEALTKASLNRGRPYPGPHFTVEEGLKKLVPLRITGKAKEATWYQHPRTGDLYQYHYGSGALARGFYKRGKDAGGTPQYARKAAEEFNPNIIGARTPVSEGGIPSTSTGKSTKSYMDNVRQTKLTEQQTNRLKFLEDELRIDQAKINAGEAPSKNFNKMLEEAARLRQLLKQ